MDLETAMKLRRQRESQGRGAIKLLPADVQLTFHSGELIPHQVFESLTCLGDQENRDRPKVAIEAEELLTVAQDDLNYVVFRQPGAAADEL